VALGVAVKVLVKMVVMVWVKVGVTDDEVV
jgi:hypothetical protein